MNEMKQGFLSRIRGSVTSPKKTFESIQEKDLRKGVIVVLILASLASWAGFNYATKSTFQIPAGPGQGGMIGQPNQSINPEQFRTTVAVFISLFDGVRVITFWLIVSVLLHLSATLLRGRGGLRRTLALTGFASTPLIFQQALRLIDSYTISKEALFSLTSAQAINQSPSLLLFNEALSIFTVFGVWVFALTTLAASVNYKASRKRALASASLAYSIYILLRLFMPII